MKPGNLLIVTGNEISEILRDQDTEILDAVSRAYQCHGREDDYLPHSIFLRFPNSEKNRIIGLPAYLGGDFQTSGMKWIASYPKNHELGLDRASAINHSQFIRNGNSGCDSRRLGHQCQKNGGKRGFSRQISGKRRTCRRSQSDRLRLDKF